MFFLWSVIECFGFFFFFIFEVVWKCLGVAFNVFVQENQRVVVPSSSISSILTGSLVIALRLEGIFG